MSITSGGTRKAGPYNGNGVTTSFPLTFKVFQASDVLVVQTDTTPTDYTLTLNTDYTVTLNPNQDSNPGGTVTMTVAPPTGYLLTIGSQVPQVQSVTLTNNGGFYPTVINTALDYVTVLIQQLSEKLGRALTMPFSTNASGQLPPVSPGSLLGWKADGTGIANVGATGVGAGGIVASNMAAGATGTAHSADTQAATIKATPADADKIPLYDSANFWYLKGLTWANLKAAFLNNGFSTITGSQMQISGDASPFWEGTQSTLGSGAAYVLNGNILIMKAWTHNTKINTSGNFTGVAATGIATVMLWGEDDVLRVFTAPSVTAGTVPTFGATPTYMLDMKSGAALLNSVMPAAVKNFKADALGINNYNCVITADKVVLENSTGAYYGVENVNLTVNANGTVGAPLSIMSTRAASTWYYRWLWWNATAGVTATLDVSSTAPTAPTGYASTDFKALLPGASRTDASGSTYLLSISTRGKKTQYVVLSGSNIAALPVMSSGVQGTVGLTGATTWVAVGVSSFAPPTASAVCLMLNNYYNNGANGYVQAAPNNSYAGWASTNQPPMQIGLPANQIATYASTIMLESANVYFASGASGGALICLGWEDNS